MHEHGNILVTKLAELQIQFESISQVIVCNTAQFLNVKKMECIMHIEIMLQCEICLNWLHLFADKDDLFENVSEFCLLNFVHSMCLWPEMFFFVLNLLRVVVRNLCVTLTALNVVAFTILCLMTAL
jgi:hypothetical protein